MSGYERNDERVSDVLSQETINRAIAADAARRAGAAGQQGQQASQQYNSASQYEPDRPGISRRETSSRRDPLTGDLVEEYSGGDPNGPSMRAHYNWDEPGKAPSNMPQSQQVQSSGGAPPPRPGQVHRTNTTVSYDASGNRVEEHDGEGSLRVRALYNEDDDPSTTYRPGGPNRGQSDRGPSPGGYQY